MVGSKVFHSTCGLTLVRAIVTVAVSITNPALQDTLAIAALEPWTRGVTLGLVSAQSWRLIVGDSQIIGHIAVWLAITCPRLQDAQTIRTPELASRVANCRGRLVLCWTVSLVAVVSAHAVVLTVAFPVAVDAVTVSALEPTSRTTFMASGLVRTVFAVNCSVALLCCFYAFLLLDTLEGWITAVATYENGAVGCLRI